MFQNSIKNAINLLKNYQCKSDIGQTPMYYIEKKFAKNQRLTSKLCNKNLENHHCKSDFVQ